ncbi:2-hydroxyglutaryl-CoA dehydratase [Spirochaetia bacterium]|nr:2-hydroxyglutaryl-CoA dehydratase [Spirochaetia bacterium]
MLAPDGTIVSLSSFESPVDQKAYFERYMSELCNTYSIAAIVSCGYGKENINTDFAVSELIALARGLFSVSPGIHSALDIGGQDTKAIQCSNGKLTRFVLNDQCAAGSGLFLQSVLRILKYDFADLQAIDSNVKPLTTVCAVFAQTEIVRAISNGKTSWELSQSVLLSLVRQAVNLLNQINREEPFALTGGLSLIPGISDFFSKFTGHTIFIPKYSTFLSAIGCAYKALELQERSKS